MTTFGHYHKETPPLTTEDQCLLFQKSLVHKWHCDQSILCVIPSPKRKLIFCGTQNNVIFVLDLETYQVRQTLHAHQGSILCLTLNENEDKLFSAGSDSLVNIWDIENDFKLLYTIYSLNDIGDIFSIIWVDHLNTLFFGSQNASISYIKIELDDNHVSTKNHNGGQHPNIPNYNEEIYQLMPSQRFDKFFDSKGSGNTSQSPTNSFTGTNDLLKPKSLIVIPNMNIIHYAHYGFVYSLKILKDLNPLTSTLGEDIGEKFSNVLISGGGDGIINIWGISPDTSSLIKLKSIDNNNSIFSMTLNTKNMQLYAGLIDGIINCWDLTTFQLIKSWEIDDDQTNDSYDANTSENSINGDHNVYAMTSSPNMDSLFMGTSMGITKKNLANNESYGNNFRITIHEPCLSLRSFIMNDESYIVSSSSNKTVSIWSVPTIDQQSSSPSEPALNSRSQSPLLESTQSTNDKLLTTLNDLISFKSVSQQPDLYQNECRECANYLVLLLRSLGAFKSELWPVDNGNPIVNGIFKANTQTPETKTILFYGHYDVIPASDSTWDTEPFQTTPKNGYIYARGATDNKGPLLSSIYAVNELQSQGKLNSNVIFIIEGEEESGSWGFNQTIERNLTKLDAYNIDYILMSNSYWLDDEIPCLNYGLRGVIRLEIEITSDNPDRHSGVHGGVVSEPSMDLIKVCSNLVSSHGEIIIDGFKGYDKSVHTTNQTYDFKNLDKSTIDSIQSLSPWEIPLYIEIANRLSNIKIDDLIKKWREPALSLHRIEMSGPDNGTVIPKSAKAKISMRLVPGQDLEMIKKSTINHIQSQFGLLNSPNHLQINIVHESEPWLGDVNNKAYKVLFDSISKEWGVEPLYIREGGSVPAIRYLERTFKCPAAHLPAGQASDNAHLNNERVRIINLFKAKDVIKRFVNNI